MLAPDIYTRVANATKIDDALASELLDEAMKYSRKKHSCYRCEDDIAEAAQDAVCTILFERPANVKEVLKDKIRKHFRNENNRNATMRRESRSHEGSGFKLTLDTEGMWRKYSTDSTQSREYDELIGKCKTDTERELVVLIVSDGVPIQDAMHALGVDRAQVRVFGRRVLDKDSIDWQKREQVKVRRKKPT